MGWQDGKPTASGATGWQSGAPAEQEFVAPTEAKAPQDAVKHPMLRKGEFFSRGALDSAAETLGLPGEAMYAIGRALGITDIPSGASQEYIKQGIRDFGQTISAPVNSMLDGDFGPNETQSTGEKFAYGAGRGVADAASFALPAAGLAKTAQAGGLAQKVSSAMASQPTLQAAAGATGGGVTETTDNAGLGLAASLAVPVGAAGVKRAITPFASQLSQAAQRLAAKAKTAGIPLTPGQETGSPSLRRVEQGFAQLPFTSGPQGAAYDTQRKAFNQAVLSKAGVSGDEATPEVIDAAFKSIGKEFDDLARATVIKADTKIIDDVHNIANEYGRRLPTDVKPVFQSYVDDFDDMHRAMARSGSNVEINGTEYQKMSSAIKARARMSANNPDLKESLYSLSRVLDDALERSSGPELRGAWQEVRNRYRNLLTVDKAAGAGTQADRASANIPYAGLRSAVKSNDKTGYGRGRGDLNEMSRVGDFLGAQKIPDPGSAGMMGTLGLLTGGGAGLATGGDPVTMGLSIAAGLTAPKLLQMAYQNPQVARYLTNQLASSPSNIGQAAAKISTAQQLGDKKRPPYLLNQGR